ncbi:MAG TPA: DUF2834 domain-containing protein [Candidatus Angelobacter sp.]|nr:DUF2834 domain-containing protein [Candidatus Angelobacter sp.]
MRAFLIVSCLAGIVIPYWFALPFFLIHGANFSLFFEEAFGTRISSFFAADLIVASVIFLVWSWKDARERGISGWWVVLLSNLVVGLSLALPLYLLKRMGGAEDANGKIGG